MSDYLMCRDGQQSKTCPEGPSEDAKSLSLIGSMASDPLLGP